MSYNIIRAFVTASQKPDGNRKRKHSFKKIQLELFFVMKGNVVNPLVIIIDSSPQHPYPMVKVNPHPGPNSQLGPQTQEV